MTAADNPPPPYWPLQTAKDQFSRLVKAAGDAPQTVTVHGKPAAIVLSPAEYDRLRKAPRKSLSAGLMRPGLLGDDEDLFERDRSDDAHREAPL